MKAIILNCKGNEQFRFGNGSKDVVSLSIHSDTLFSGIINVYNLLYSNVDELINNFAENKLMMSSAFPILKDIKNNSNIFFIPKPDILYPIPENKRYIKLSKKIKFVSLGVFKLISESISNEDDNITSALDLTNGTKFFVIDNKFCVLKNELSIIPVDYKPYTEITSPKVFVNTTKTEDTFYYETNLYLNNYVENGEMIYTPQYYFLLDSENLNSDIYNKFITSLRVLCDEGIGGEKSCGKGIFAGLNEKEMYFNSTKSNFLLSLSLINPLNQSEFNDILIYDFIKRGGGSLGDENSADYHRKLVNMVTEGSIIKNKITGRLVNISPEININPHNVFRNGKAFLIPFGGKYEFWKI